MKHLHTLLQHLHGRPIFVRRQVAAAASALLMLPILGAWVASSPLSPAERTMARSSSSEASVTVVSAAAYGAREESVTPEAPAPLTLVKSIAGQAVALYEVIRGGLAELNFGGVEYTVDEQAHDADDAPETRGVRVRDYTNFQR